MPVKSPLVKILSAALIAGSIAAAHFATWSWFNRDVSVENADNKINGYAYSAYQHNQSPFKQTFPSTDEIRGDLDILSQTSKRIRTYSSFENPQVTPLAREQKLSVLAGAWLDKDEERNERELKALIQTTRKNEHVDRVMVGNESVLRGDLSVNELIAYLDRARDQIVQPVSSAEPWHVWMRNPELVKHVDYIAVHLLPYHEGLAVQDAPAYVMERYHELAKAFPNKHIVIGEVGWPSQGPVIGSAVPSPANQARFMREFLNIAQKEKLDYYVMEAFDQPWKTEVEGWAGAYWGMFDADRTPKFNLTGAVQKDANWTTKALLASLLGFIPVFLFCLYFNRFKTVGLVGFGLLTQATVTAFITGLALPVDYYFATRDMLALGGLIVAMLISASVMLSNGFEFVEVMFNGRWKRHFTKATPLPASKEPMVSIHLACCNEPPEMVIATINSLVKLDYSNYEVLVIDNNTKDEAKWKPIEQYMARLGDNFKFFHLPSWPGFKAGALNFALSKTDPRAEVVGVVDADYVVSRDWLSSLAPHFLEDKVAVVQAPQAHRDWQNQFFRRMCNWEFDGFFRIGMHHRNERNALIQHGTMTLVRREALDNVGGWSEWCICEDTELGLRLIKAGYETRYVDEVLGRGLTPSSFTALKSQRFRWAFGAMQILKHHLPALIGKSSFNGGQRYHFLTGWFSWFGDALQFIFASASLFWTLGMLLLPKSFSLPVTVMAAPVLGFLIVKAIMGPVLYRNRMQTSWKDIFGASLASLGLSHAIARGVMAGLVKRRGEFVTTTKGWQQKGSRLAALAPIREEIGLLLALCLAATAMATNRGLHDVDVMLWVTMLLLQSLPYIAAIGCQVAAHLPETRAEFVADEIPATAAVEGHHFGQVPMAVAKQAIGHIGNVLPASFAQAKETGQQMSQSLVEGERLVSR